MVMSIVTVIRVIVIVIVIGKDRIITIFHW